MSALPTTFSLTLFLDQLALVGSISDWGLCWSGFTIKALKSSMPKFFGGDSVWWNWYILWFPALWTYYLWKITRMVSRVQGCMCVVQSNRFQPPGTIYFSFPLLKGAPFSTLVHPCRLACVMTQLVIVCSCAKLFIQLFWIKARYKIKSIPLTF